MWVVFIKGALVSLSLIVAIGAQNAFLLKQGLKQQYIFWLCLICALSDSVLILVGTLGFQHLLTEQSLILSAVKYLGALFLMVYGLQHFYQAYKRVDTWVDDEKQTTSLSSAIITCLILTWLNPHVHLDTVILIGAVSTAYHEHLYAFIGGAILASWTFFFCLGYGAQYLKPLFMSQRAWQVLDIVIGVVMLLIAWKILVF